MRPVMLSTLCVWGLACSLLLQPSLVRADDPAPEPRHGATTTPEVPAGATPTPTTDRPTSEIWHFRKGDAARTVDVSGLAEVVRKAVLARMAVDGYRRVEAPARGRDLEADARELVERGGRFLGRAGAFGIQGILLGAPVRLERLAEATWLRVLDAPAGSLAAGLGLVRGDRIVSLDGRTPTAARLTGLRRVERAPGQLALRVMRREGRTEDWTLTFSRGAPPASR